MEFYGFMIFSSSVVGIGKVSANFEDTNPIPGKLDDSDGYLDRYMGTSS